MSRIQQLPPAPTLVETGPVRFGDDYAGLFIRSVEAAMYAKALRLAIPFLGYAKYHRDAQLLEILCDRIESCCEYGQNEAQA